MSSASSELSALLVPWGVVLVSLLAFPVSYALSLCSAMEDARLVFLAGVLACTAIVPLTYYCVVRGEQRRDAYFYIFTMFAFTSMVDLALALTIDGHTDVLLFYLAQGEVYLTTAHGLWINLWDGSFHYLCYLVLSACLSRRGLPRGEVLQGGLVRTVGLLWAGSILNSMICLFVASAVGSHAHHIKPSYLLNIPYALLPGVFLWRLLQARPTAVSAPSSTPSSTSVVAISERKPLWLWLVDVPLLVLVFLSGCLCVVRLLVVLRSGLGAARLYGADLEAHLLDPAAYPTLQMATYAFYGLPYLGWASVRIWRGVPAPAPAPSSTANAKVNATAEVEAAQSFRDWTLVAIGALLQGTFSYVGAALHQGSAFQSSEWIPQSRAAAPLATFVAANALLLLTPILILARMNFGANVRVSSPSVAAATANTRAKTHGQ